MVAAQLLRRQGVAATVGHAAIIALRRLHSAVFDRPLQAGLPFPLTRQYLLAGLTLRTCTAAERDAGAPCSPIPCKTLDWAIRGTGIDPAAWHFVDIGSGTGWALQVARAPFRAFTGVEFVEELHKPAQLRLADRANAKSAGYLRQRACDRIRDLIAHVIAKPAHTPQNVRTCADDRTLIRSALCRSRPFCAIRQAAARRLGDVSARTESNSGSSVPARQAFIIGA